jgi:hypothetical protein
MQRLDVGSIGTEPIFSDDEGEMRVVLTQFDQEAFTAWRSPAFGLCHLIPIGSGMSGITARKSGWIIAAPNIW